jgi:hypothetical protein
VHPIGRAIFIFAGGVYTTFKDFSEAMEKTESSRSRRTKTQLQGPIKRPAP